MEKRLLVAIALSFGLLLLWHTLIVPPPPPVPAGGHLEQTARGASAPAPGPPSLEPSETGTPPPPALPTTPVAGAGAEEEIQATSPEERTIDTELYRIRFGNQGARVLSWQLKKYLDDQGKPLELISPAVPKLKQFPLRLEFGDEALTRRCDQALFRMEVGPGAHGRGTSVAFRFGDGHGLVVSKELYFSETSYVAHLKVDAFLDGKPIEGRIFLGPGFGPHTEEATSARSGGEITRAIIYRDGKIVRIPRSALKDSAELREEGGVIWAGLEDHYFATLFLPVEGATGAIVRVHPLIEEGRERDFLSLGVDLPRTRNYDLYVGPKDHELLAGLRIGIDGLVDFGFFGAIAQALFFMLKFINRTTGNWGWSIILLTFFIRLVFFPLTQKSSVTMRRTQEKMKKIQPKMNSIKERYRKMKKDYENRQKMNEEIMTLYRKEGVNPLSGLGGCLPLLLQLPILWGFYNLLNAAIELRQAPFALWIVDLSKKDPYYVTPIVMGITMLIQQVLTGSSIPDPVQRRMMMLMPLMFTWFFKDLPSGLVLYWLVNNVLAIGQQYLINSQAAREDGRERAPAKS